MSQTGIIFDISHYMLEDGPGIRTNVFLKGCWLHCKWCSNAFGLEQQIQMAFQKQKCTGCGACLNVCEHQAIQWNEKEHVVMQDFKKCINCMKCVSVCLPECKIFPIPGNKKSLFEPAHTPSLKKYISRGICPDSRRLVVLMALPVYVPGHFNGAFVADSYFMFSLALQKCFRFFQKAAPTPLPSYSSFTTRRNI